MINLEKFLAGYIAAALFTETDETSESGGDPLDDNYTRSDIALDSFERMAADCVKFIRENEADLESYSMEFSDEKAGHDFWLTRGGHGVGFWDRGLGELGDRLTEACESYSDSSLYVGDDGNLHYWNS